MTYKDIIKSKQIYEEIERRLVSGLNPNKYNSSMHVTDHRYKDGIMKLSVDLSVLSNGRIEKNEEAANALEKIKSINPIILKRIVELANLSTISTTRLVSSKTLDLVNELDRNGHIDLAIIALNVLFENKLNNNVDPALVINSAISLSKMIKSNKDIYDEDDRTSMFRYEMLFYAVFMISLTTDNGNIIFSNDRSVPNLYELYKTYDSDLCTVYLWALERANNSEVLSSKKTIDFLKSIGFNAARAWLLAVQSTKNIDLLFSEPVIDFIKNIKGNASVGLLEYIAETSSLDILSEGILKEKEFFTKIFPILDPVPQAARAAYEALSLGFKDYIEDKIENDDKSSIKAAINAIRLWLYADKNIPKPSIENISDYSDHIKNFIKTSIPNTNVEDIENIWDFVKTHFGNKKLLRNGRKKGSSSNEEL
ncbi:MAG: hypothetical protein ACP5RP_03810 [Candidatus Micrarchaeia archaeon]